MKNLKALVVLVTLASLSHACDALYSATAPNSAICYTKPKRQLPELPGGSEVVANLDLCHSNWVQVSIHAGQLKIPCRILEWGDDFVRFVVPNLKSPEVLR